MLFKDILGQAQIKDMLRKNVENSRIAHAIFLTGPSGIGKFRLAMAYLQYINCQHPTDGDSCGQCLSCRMFADFAHPNLHIIYPIYKPKSDRPAYCVDFFENFRQMLQENDYFDLADWIRYLDVENKQIRIFESESSQIAEFISKPAYNKGYKGIIIWQPDKMNKEFANKILKMLEEPPSRTVFIFVGEQPELLLPTIRSRLQTFFVPKLSNDDIKQYLGNTIDPTDLDYIAKVARGSVLRAKKLVNDDEQHQLFFNYFVELMRNAWLVGRNRNYAALLKLRQWSLDMAEKDKGREFQKAFLQYVQTQLRENFIANFHQPQLSYQTKAENAFSQKFAPFIHANNVEALMNEFDRAETQIMQNGNAKIIFFDLCLQCIVLIKKD